MVEFAAIVIFAAAIFIIIMANTKSNGSNRRSYPNGRGGRSYGRTNAFAPWPDAEIPSALGVPYGHPARTSAERLESALGLDFESRVKDRMLKEYPKMSDKEWAWTWFELKRYFLMCGMLRGVPMYSRQVDAAWHEMLMFTREYEQFCSRFCGEMIHHAPHAPDVQPLTDERAWFDWVYGELFAQAPASGRLWGAFFRTRMPAQKLEELSEWSEAELRDQWFNIKATARYADLSNTVDYLIDRAKSQLVEARRKDKQPFRREAISSNSYGYDPVLGATGMLSGLLIYHSISSPNDFTQQMDQEQNEDERKANGSGDSTYACSGSSDEGRDHSGGDDGGPGGDSSCGSGGGDSGGSSCGGGCSS